MSISTRRRFLQTTALGIASASLSSARVAAAQIPAAAPIVDWHAHWIGPHVVALLGARTAPRPPQGAGWFDIDARLRDMDANNVGRQVLAWVGGAFDGALPPEEARPLWRAQNDDLAALVRAHPSRFSALASLPTANVVWAAEELARVHGDLRLIGAVLPLDAFVSLAGARALAPIFAVAQTHRSHIFVHRGAASADVPGQQLETAVQVGKNAMDFAVLSANFGAKVTATSATAAPATSAAPASTETTGSVFSSSKIVDNAISDVI